MVTITSNKIINPKSDDRYTRTVMYQEIYETIPLSYENIANSITKRICTSSTKGR